MEVRITYSKEQLEAAVDFISDNNIYFLGKKEEIRQSILDMMRKIAKDPDDFINGTMGFVLWGEREFEGMNSDENTIHFDITVNPNLGSDEDETYIEEVLNE